MDYRSLFSRITKAVVVAGVGIMLLGGPLADLALAQPKELPGKGAGGGLPVAITGNAPEAMSSAYNNILTELTRSGVVAFMNALQVFFGQLAYDAADYIASGGNGQSAVFYKKGFGDYIKDVSSDSAGEFMGSLSSGEFFRGAGFNLCQPKNPLTLLKIQVTLGNFFPGNQGKFTRPKPKCDFKDVLDNWDSVAQTMSNDDVLSNIQSNFNTNGSDLGIATSIFNQQLFKVSSDSLSKEKERQEGGGFKAVSDSISGNVKTPGAVVSEATKDEIVRSPKASQSQVTGAILSNAFEVGPIQLAAYTTSVFLNTLGSKMMKRIFEKGLDAFDFSDLQAKTAVLGPDSILTQGKTDARKANIDLRTPRLQEVATFEILSELRACPATNRGLWSCSMDQAMSQAAQPQGSQGGMTITDALSRDYLHPSWKLIPDTMAKENRDPLCYTYAYCAGNLQKLRLARLLPVGFEFAANSEENLRRCYSSAGCVTLKEVVDGFNSCNAQGGLDAAHPWCHLIDPNWVVTSVAQQCSLTGYGDNLMTAELGQRKQECQDIQTCLQRNDKGECIGGYGYCMAEKTVYRFQADECSATYASCRVYTNRSSQPVNFLRNTLDYGTCNAENVGCMWYATTREATSTAADKWIGTLSSGPRMYFDKDLETCPAGDDGCTKLYRTATGQSALNLIVNASFENVATDTQRSLSSWAPLTAQTTVASASGASSVFGGAAQEFPDASSLPAGIRQRVPIVGLRTYTFSVYLRLKSGAGSGAWTGTVTQYDQNNTLIIPSAQDFRSQGCLPQSNNIPTLNAFGGAITNEWQRYQCSFLSAPRAAMADINLAGMSVRMDGVQLEESEAATPFLEGINTALQQVHLKLPPDDLACTGASSTDTPQCSNYAKVCRQVDAGCDGYTEVTGGAEIPGILSSNDVCPAACVGYAEYRKQPSAFDYVHSIDTRFDDPTDTTSTYFIPQTAGQCTQAEVGCEEFTNLSGASGAGEQKNYFSYTRACEKPDANTQTYFTWEGSDVTGFQLRTWSLKKQGSTNEAPRSLVKISASQTTYKEPESCNQASWRAGLDPDCRQFYTAGGAVYYAYYSLTILSTEQCVAYRLNRATPTDCQKTGGDYNVATGECVYQVYEPESRSCSAAAVSCRAYAGAGAGNVLSLLNADFRNGVGTFANGTISNEALLVGDSSLRLSPSGSGSSAVFTTNVSVSTTASNLLRVTFWAKAPGATTNVIALQTAASLTGSRVNVGTVTVTPDWQQFTVGLFMSAGASNRTLLFFTAPVRNAQSFLYIDQVEVSRVRDVVYAREGTWNTPQSCDQTSYGVPQPQAMLGCQAYKNRRGEISNVRQFSRLCKQEIIGCTGFVDTRNSDSVSAETFVQDDRTPVPGFGPAVTVRPGDRYVYAIDEPSKRCPVSSASCRAFGLPEYSSDRRTVEKYTTVYYKDDITKYGQALCKPSALFCEAFTHGAATEYFKDPKNHACEYKERVTVDANASAGVAAGIYSGWFMTGTSTASGASVPCYPDVLSQGSTFDMVRTGDAGYQGYGAVCSEQHGECTEFRDSNDHSDPVHPTGKPYYFIRNDRLDTSSCAGNVDTGRGCVLMRDMSDAATKYNSAASYAKYSANGFTPVTPVNCVDNPSDPFCTSVQITGRCEGTARATNAAGATLAVGDGPRMSDLPACRIDADCTVSRRVRTDRVHVYTGTCVRSNDANILVKVNMDRDCSQWLGCQSSETVFDAATGRYKEVCTNLAMCDQGSGQAGDAFCSHYVKRETAATEPVLTKGAYFDMKRYVRRAIGLGEKDYSGYSIPNSFQVPDLASTRVAANGLGEGADVSRFVQDYRLAAVVPIPRSTVAGACTYAAANDTQARVLCKNTGEVTEYGCSGVSELAARYPSLLLCQSVANGRIGFYNKAEIQDSKCAPVNCYLPIHGKDDKADFQQLVEKFSLADPNTDNLLSDSFPPAICRAYPEADSPYSAEYVTEWDMSKTPPQPSQRAQGYQNAKTCEFGEECACTYKRVSYNTAAVTKFYGVYSQNVAAGVCQGGPRDGQSCIPDTIFTAPKAGQAGTAEGQAEVAAIEGSTVSQSCGPAAGGGHCVALSKIEIVRGYFGQCLERDSTRTSGASGKDTPCLTWNPTPILFGDKDIYHYIPTAGYLPPENAGQYYCTSNARKPQTIRLNSYYFSGFTLNDNIALRNLSVSKTPIAGSITKLSYNDRYVSDGDCATCTGNRRGATLDGREIKGSQAADQCEYADNGQDDDGQDQDESGLRIVSTGSDVNNSYSETFFKVNSTALATAFYKVSSTSATAEQVFSAALDSNFGYMTIQPIVNPNGNGRIACGYQADWVDGLGSFDYDKDDDIKRKDSEWQQKFRANYNPTLTRGSEQIFTLSTDPTHPVAVPCVSTNEKDPAWGQCYLKFWETSYRLPDKKSAFTSLYNDNGSQVVRNLEDIRAVPHYNECKADKPYFSIRAVFQASAESGAQGGAIASQITKDSIQGPWRFVGFWVTSCAAKANDYRFIYMNVDLTSADVCRELAEVKSRDSSQNAAFTDRIWKEGGYTLPGLGLQYGSRFSPFSSALNTGPAGREPLFQNGNMATGFSPLTPPTFLSSGVDTYYRQAPNPKDKWAYLSNIFARVYRVYRYHEQPVTRDDQACTDGPLKGQRCTRDLLTGTGAEGAIGTNSKMCNPNGTCKPGRLSADESKNNVFCNSMSGINSGLSCGGKIDMCHTGAVDPRTQGQQLRLPCEVKSGWTQVGDSWRNPADQHDLTQKNAANAGAFRCPNAWYSMRPDAYCSAPGEYSAECPVLVIGHCVKPTSPAGDVIGGDNTPAAARIPGHCEMRLPNLTNGNGSPMYPQSSGSYTVNGVSRGYLTSGTQSNGQPENAVNSANFSWVQAPPTSPSCYVDSDCSYTDKNFYLGGQFPNAESNLAGGPLLSSRSRLAQHNEGDATACGDDVNSAACKTLRLGAGLNQTSLFASGDPPYHNQLKAFWANYHQTIMRAALPMLYDALPITATSRGDGNFVLSGADAGRSAVGSGRHFIRDELDRWPGVGSSANATAEAFTDILSVVSSIPGVSEFLDFLGLGSTVATHAYYNLAACEPALNFPPRFIGKCEGGLKDGNVCRFQMDASGDMVADTEGDYSCNTTAPAAVIDAARFSCKPVSQTTAGGVITPINSCLNPADNGDANSADPDLDNNVCTHGAGYYPRLDICPDPTDEFCGLISYRITGNQDNQSMDPTSLFNLPTDVTAGHYQPSALGLPASVSRSEDFNYISYYRPQPPRIAAPDARACTTPGQCPIQRTDAFAFNGQSEGIINVAGGQHKSTIQFYGWAANNQMPLRAVNVDWGDGAQQSLPDARLKNHKPFCGVQKECSDPVKGLGLTCQTDSDCPSGTGLCKAVGTCSKDAARICRADSECTVGGQTDKCMFRTFFGNTPEACEANYFQFDHLYTCNGLASVNNVSCTGAGGLTNRCSRNPDKVCSTSSECAPGDSCVAGLAPPGGCFDATVNSCRFTPRVWMEDNWGWCTGECRQLAVTQDTLVDIPASLVKHTFGGCYSGSTQGSDTQNVRANDRAVSDGPSLRSSNLVPVNECGQELPAQSGSDANLRPWIVYPGALYLRTNSSGR